MKRGIFYIIFFLILNGCAQYSSLVGPSYTFAKSGSILQAGNSVATSHMLKKIHDSLTVGPACFCMTVPNSERIQEAISGMYKLPEYCKITPGNSWKGNNTFGDPYIFYLEDCVPSVEEYLMPKTEIMALADECGLINTFYQNAGAFLETRDECNITIDKNLDWNVTCLYDIYIFAKKSSV